MQNSCATFESTNINEKVVSFTEITFLKELRPLSINKVILLGCLNIFQPFKTLAKQTTKDLECTKIAMIES